MTLPQLLLHLAHRNPQQRGNLSEVIDRFVGGQDILTGRHAAHRASLSPHTPYHVAVTLDSPTDPGGMVLDGRYRLDAKIATGGMSTVYRGFDLRLERPVALKVMDPRYAGDHQFLTRFRREALAVARLKHPGLVAVYDRGDNPTYLVMELIEGGTLRELLRERGPMPPHAVVAVLGPVLGGLGVAHRAGLVHRDLKPENVLISHDGEVKLVDFGLVRAVAEAGITSTSVILGTAAYLSPEQVVGSATGPRSDVYALGVMTFELLTGATPFTGDNALAIAHARLDRDVPAPSSVIDGVPPQFDEFVAKATARDPERRFGDAGDMAAGLDAIIDELALPHFRVPAPKNSAQRTAAALEPRPRPDADGVGPTRHLSSPPLEEENSPEPRRFAGIDVAEFAWARQRARRTVLAWILVVLILTGLTAAAAWSLGTHLPVLIGRPAAGASVAKHLSDQERKLQALLSVQPGVAGRLVPSGQIGVGDVLGTTETLGDVLPGDLDVDAPGMGAQRPVDLEETLHLIDDAVEVSGLVPRR